MARLLAQFFEDWRQQRVFEVLGNDRAVKTEKTAAETQPLKIAVVITGDDERALATLHLLEIFDFNIIAKIFGGQPRAPQQVEHRARKMLVRLAHDLFALALK